VQVGVCVELACDKPVNLFRFGSEYVRQACDLGVDAESNKWSVCESVGRGLSQGTGEVESKLFVVGDFEDESRRSAGEVRFRVLYTRLGIFCMFQGRRYYLYEVYR